MMRFMSNCSQSRLLQQGLFFSLLIVILTACSSLMMTKMPARAIDQSTTLLSSPEVSATSTVNAETSFTALAPTSSPTVKENNFDLRSGTPTSSLEALATSQALPMYQVLNRLKDHGYLAAINGTYHRLNDASDTVSLPYARNINLIDGFYPQNFVLRANVNWNKPDAKVVDKDNAGCGFAFHVNTDGNYEVKISLDGVALVRRLAYTTQYSFKSFLVAQKVYREFQAQGEEEVLLIVQENQVILVIDGHEILNTKDDLLTSDNYREGLLAFLIENGANKGEAMCRWSNLELWELVPSAAEIAFTGWTATPTPILDPETSYQRGVSLYQQGNYEAALQQFDKVIELQPKAYVAYYARAVIFLTRGEYPRALENINQAIALAPDLAVAYYRRAQIYERVGDIVNAEADYKKAKELGYQGD